MRLYGFAYTKLTPAAIFTVRAPDLLFGARAAMHLAQHGMVRSGKKCASTVNAGAIQSGNLSPVSRASCFATLGSKVIR